MRNFYKCTKVATAFLICLSFIFVSTAYAYAENTDNKNYVYLGGEAFGIKMFTKGALIVKLEEFTCGNEKVCPAIKSGLEVNDNIIKANNKEITSNEQFQKIIKNSKGNKIQLKVIRNNKEINLEVTPKLCSDNNYKIGAWIRDSCAGIGTISYYDTDNMTYAALGHGICDVDTKELMPLYSGEVVNAEINGITKSTCGKAGTLNGYLTDKNIGDITLNTQLGVYGKLNSLNFEKPKLEIASKNELKTGSVVFYSTIDESGVQEFDAKITSIGDTSDKTNKNFVIEITDKELLEKTGGIVQGMSGSPVVQEGKLVGIINHVFVNEPNKGYCVVAENMKSNFDTKHNILYKKAG